MWQKVRVFLSGVLVVGPLAALALSIACVNSPTTSTPTTTIAACQLNNSAKVSFENKSTTNKTYDVVWDGSHITTLAPTEQSSNYTVEAGVTHTLQFKFTNSGQAACTIAHPIPVVCTSTNWSCTG